jgi:TetR/AcrR family transcriptional regulator, transcriptional repressor for nem operon
VPEQVDRRADATRSLIVEAASRQFARKSYSEVNHDDIVAHGEVTNGAFYFHFRSKHESALAIIEHQRQAGYLPMTEVLSRKMPALETLVDLTWVIAIRDVEENATRAGLNLSESIARRR